MYRYKKGIVIIDFRMIKVLLVDDIMLNFYGFIMKFLKCKLNIIVIVLSNNLFGLVLFLFFVFVGGKSMESS